MKDILIKNATLVNEGETYVGSVLINDGLISEIIRGEYSGQEQEHRIIDARDKILIPGVIDDQVHFREPGLTHKGSIATESAAAAAGGVTSYMEMPNTNPQTISLSNLVDKYEIGEQTSLVNYSFYLGATNDNLDKIKKINPLKSCGVKVFMGASTGNMLIDNIKTLEGIFAECPVLITTHCEDEEIIRRNTSAYMNKYGENMPMRYHPEIRSEEACYKSSSLAVDLANRYNARLHVLHISTGRELSLFSPEPFHPGKRITAEVCIHHLWFDDSSYDTLGTHIKWNPAIKTADDRKALMQGLLENRLDVIATDHAPHTLAEKGHPYWNAPSGGPMIQHSLLAMLKLWRWERISLDMVVDKMCHKPAELFQVKNRGYIREGYFADLVIIDPDSEWTVNRDNIYYKCGWSPMEGETFHSKVIYTLVNGNIVYENPEGDPSQAIFNKEKQGMRLEFDR